jgi:hypothetical protein
LVSASVVSYRWLSASKTGKPSEFRFAAMIIPFVVQYLLYNVRSPLLHSGAVFFVAISPLPATTERP